MREEILQCIYGAFDEISEDRDDLQMEKSVDTPIHGSTSALDSLSLINFIIAVEERLERDLGVTVLLSDDRALSQESSPFESVASLAKYIEQLVGEAK